jgi:hypothetical protein
MDAQEAKGFDASEFTDEQCRNILAAIETARTLGFRDGQMAAAAHSAQVEAELREKDEQIATIIAEDAHGEASWILKYTTAEAELVKLREENDRLHRELRSYRKREGCF